MSTPTATKNKQKAMAKHQKAPRPHPQSTVYVPSMLMVILINVANKQNYADICLRTLPQASNIKAQRKMSEGKVRRG